MKKLITILVVSFCMFIGTASAAKPEWAGKGKQAKDAKQAQKEVRKQNKDKYGLAGDEHGKKHKNKDKDKDRDRGEHKRDDGDRGKHDEVRERLREKKAASEQKELEHISETGEEKRRKWWKFWE